MPTFRCLGYEVDRLCFAPQALPCPVYPDVCALDPVLGLGQPHVVSQLAALLATHDDDVMSRCQPPGNTAAIIWCLETEFIIVIKREIRD